MICFIVIIYNLPLHVHLFSVSDFLSSDSNLNMHVCMHVQRSKFKIIYQSISVTGYIVFPLSMVNIFEIRIEMKLKYPSVSLNPANDNIPNSWPRLQAEVRRVLEGEPQVLPHYLRRAGSLLQVQVLGKSRRLWVPTSTLLTYPFRFLGVSKRGGRRLSGLRFHRLRSRVFPFVLPQEGTGKRGEEREKWRG